MSKRILSLMLVLTLFLVVMGSAYATGSTRENSPASETSDVGTIVRSGTVTNPLYPEYRIKESTETRNYRKASRNASSGSNTTYASVEDAGAYLRGELVDRTETVTFSFDAKSMVSGKTEDEHNEILSSLVEEIFEESLRHTGIGREGDFLRWHYGGYVWTYSENPNTGLCQYTYTLEYYTTADQEKELDTQIKAVEDDFDFDAEDSDFERVLAIYDYICGHVVYDYENLEDRDYTLKYSAYAALINGTAVCQGYANLFYRLALDSGLNARLVAGLGNGGNHAWNIVELDGQFYDLDATWDEPIYKESRSFQWFLKGSSTFDRHVAGGSSDGTRQYTPEELSRLSTTDYALPLTIRKQPKDVYVKAGDYAMFTVMALGNAVTYQWHYRFSENGNWSSSGSNDYFRFQTQESNDGMQFYCTVSDGTTTVDTSIASLHIGDLVFEITEQPQSVQANVGETVQFHVGASGSGLQYQWQYRAEQSDEWKDSGMDGSTTDTIAVPVAEKRNGQRYRCVVSDEFGNTLISEEAALKAVVPLGITKNPSSVTVTEGKTATFAVTAKGSDLSYRWQYYGSGKWKDSGMPGSNTATIFVPATLSRDGQKYRCIVTDGNGKTVTSKAATLTVRAAITITEQPTDISVKEGETATFSVAASGEDLEYRWQYYGSGNKWKDSGMEGAQTDTISVPAAEKRNGQKYRCVISDSSGNTVTSEAAALTVRSILKIMKNPENVTMTIGKKAHFSVVATGQNLSYQWQYCGEDNKWKNSSMTGCTTDTVTVPVTEKRNGQKYRCVVTDGEGNVVRSREATLTAVAGITITRQPADMTVREGENAHFNVAATGQNLSYQWQYCGENNKWKNSGMTGSTTTTVSVPATTKRNGQKYRCIITDSAGGSVISESATLSLK